MNNKNLICALLLSVCCTVVTSEIVAQHPEMAKKENARIDSLNKAQVTEAKKVKDDKENLSDLKAERANTKMQAREAKRIERDANDAARKSKIAYRSEKQAQKARKQADKQAQKAEKARKISDGNN